jgi:hypothetical protein
MGGGELNWKIGQRRKERVGDEIRGQGWERATERERERENLLLVADKGRLFARVVENSGTCGNKAPDPFT